MKIFEKAPAKINLSLDVLHKRPDGYHEVEMVMTMVDLADRIEMQELPRDTIIISSQAGYIPLDEKNLAFQAARLIKDRYDVKQGVYIHLDKRIPVAAGLAGGSSDAAATLRGLNRLWNLNIPDGGAAGAWRRAWLRCAFLCNRRDCPSYRTRREAGTYRVSAAVLGRTGEAADQRIDIRDLREAERTGD